MIPSLSSFHLALYRRVLFLPLLTLRRRYFILTASFRRAVIVIIKKKEEKNENERKTRKTCITSLPRRKSTMASDYLPAPTKPIPYRMLARAR